MINETLVGASNLSIVLAIVLYMVALIAFAADLAGVSVRRSDARLRAAEEQQRSAEAQEAPAARTMPELAGVSALGASSAAGGATRVGDDAGSDAGMSPRSPSADMRAAGDLPADARATDRAGGVSRAADEEATSGALSARSFGFAMMAAAALLHFTGMLTRGLATGRVPWSNMYEFAMSGSAGVSIIFLLFALRRRELRLMGLFVVLPVLLTMLVAQVFWIVPAAELTPSLQNSHWLVIHVVVAVLSTGLFTLGALMSMMQLVLERYENARMAAGGAAWGRAGRVLEMLPGSKTLEELAFRLNAVGFVGWTFTLIFGAIWAREAWGRYWGWDPKEVWTFVIWVVYAAYLHARATRGFRGSRAAWFALAGFLCVIFNFTIVNTVINGLHSYSGL